jgi:anti-sigma factor RsiW
MTGCDLVQPLAAELALGTLSGAERSAALAHLEACADCRREVEELSTAADALLLAAVDVDPPVGFEVRLLERMRLRDGAPAEISALDAPAAMPEGTIHRLPFGQRVSRRVLGVAAAAALLAGIGGALIGVAAAPGHSQPGPVALAGIGALRTAALVVPGPAGSKPVRTGEVVIAPGQPAWVLMEVSDLSGTSWVSCVVQVGSRSISIGNFRLNGGYGSWAAPMQVSGKSVSSARIVGSDGKVLAVATF